MKYISSSKYEIHNDVFSLSSLSLTFWCGVPLRTAHSQAQAQPITLSPKVLARAPSEQSKVYERLEESVADKVNLCAAAASIITGTRRYFALSASLDPRNPRFNNAGLRRNGGGKLVQRGDRRRG